MMPAVLMALFTKSSAATLPVTMVPIYTIIDMVETAENVWSDSCVSAMVDRDLH
jgi:Na+/H+-dicarboxylate symporter